MKTNGSSLCNLVRKMLGSPSAWKNSKGKVIVRKLFFHSGRNAYGYLKYTRNSLKHFLCMPQQELYNENEL